MQVIFRVLKAEMRAIFQLGNQVVFQLGNMEIRLKLPLSIYFWLFERIFDDFCLVV